MIYVYTNVYIFMTIIIAVDNTTKIRMIIINSISYYFFYYVLLLSYCCFSPALSENKYFENLESQQTSVRHAISYYQFAPHFDPPGPAYDWNESSVCDSYNHTFSQLWFYHIIRCFTHVLCLKTSSHVCSHGLTLCQMCPWVQQSLQPFTQIYHSATVKVRHRLFFTHLK